MANRIEPNGGFKIPSFCTPKTVYSPKNFPDLENRIDTKKFFQQNLVVSLSLCLSGVEKRAEESEV